MASVILTFGLCVYFLLVAERDVLPLGLQAFPQGTQLAQRRRVAKRLAAVFACCGRRLTR